MRQTVSITLLVLICIAALVYYQPFTHSKAFHSSPSPIPVSDSGSILHPPTVTAHFIDQVLAQSGSPAAGVGELVYQLGLETGIDPAYALAFFKHESAFGTRGVATVTKSWGNIRCTPEWPQCVDGYRAYASWNDGVRDWFQLIQNVYLPAELDTVEKIIPVYAPAADNNDETAYIQSLQSQVEMWREDQN